ncbi:hypothetical protein QUF72_22400, partial [Desulfobacterales bacterium HSG2]|nr:hypothetical protein [Desulfobacterales bacterium HSG2]
KRETKEMKRGEISESSTWIPADFGQRLPSRHGNRHVSGKTSACKSAKFPKLRRGNRHVSGRDFQNFGSRHVNLYVSGRDF